MHFWLGTFSFASLSQGLQILVVIQKPKFLGRCLGQLGLESPAIPSGLMLRSMSHLCTWQPLMVADDFGLTERSTSLRSHQLSSTGGMNASLSPPLTALKRKHWGFLFLFVCVLLTDMCKLMVTRNPLGCSAGLPVPPSASQSDPPSSVLDHLAQRKLPPKAWQCLWRLPKQERQNGNWNLPSVTQRSAGHSTKMMHAREEGCQDLQAGI